jgi:hypothetical protein
MKCPEDQAWDQVVERIELEVTDAQLADAERALSGVEAEQVSPDFVATVMARATAEGVEEVEAAPVRLQLLPRFRRFAAAAAMLLFGTKLSAATTIGVVAAVTTVVLVVIQNSDEMTYPEVLQLLSSSNSSLEQTRAGLFEVSKRINSAVRMLQRMRDDVATPPGLADATREGLQMLAAGQGAETAPVVDNVIEAAVRSGEVSRTESDRLSYVQSTLSLVTTGLKSIENVAARDPRVVAERDLYLRRLRAVLER